MKVNNYQMGIDSFTELLHELRHSHRNNRTARNVTEAQRSPRNEDMYTRTHQQSGAIRLNTRITIRNIGYEAYTTHS